MFKSKYAYLSGVLGISFVCVVSGLLLYQKFIEPVVVPKNTVSSVQGPTPTPFAFAEMTIPYLRRQKFQSSMTNLETIAKQITYTSYRASYISEGLTIYGLLTIPTGEQPQTGWPAIIFLHGYIPPTLYKTNGQYSSHVDYLARNGFVVFKPDLRGHDQSEGEPGGAYYSADYIVDTLNAYVALSTFDTVNPKGIGLWGHSMAGNVVMRTAVAKTSIPAVVIWAGAVYTYEDMQKNGIQDNSYRPPTSDAQRTLKRQKLRETHGDYTPTSQFWRQVAVTEYLKDFQGAVEIHHATNDDVVNVEYSRNLVKLLDNTSVPHTLFEYPDGGHNISGTSFSIAMRRTVDFFKQHLK